MTKSYLKPMLLILWVLFLLNICEANEPLDSNMAIFHGDSSFYILHPPDGWNLALEEAQLEGYSAGFYPNQTSYATSDIVINTWIFKRNGLSKAKFIEADTLNYLEVDERLQIRETDTLLINDQLNIIIFEFNDPGGWSSLAEVAYIDAVAEIVIYELHVGRREDYLDAHEKFREALGKFAISMKGQPPEQFKDH